jgi:hypothetical protein
MKHSKLSGNCSGGVRNPFLTPSTILLIRQERRGCPTSMILADRRRISCRGDPRGRPLTLHSTQCSCRSPQGRPLHIVYHAGFVCPKRDLWDNLRIPAGALKVIVEDFLFTGSSATIGCPRVRALKSEGPLFNKLPAIVDASLLGKDGIGVSNAVKQI